MSTGWYLFLFLFIFGVTAQSVNVLGIWDTNYTDARYTISTDAIQSSVQEIQDTPVTVFAPYVWVVNFITILASGIVAAVSLPALFYMIGWPQSLLVNAIIQIIQAPSTLVFFVWIFEIVTGRQIG